MFFHFHPFEPFIKKDTTQIIVGTLPPPRFCTEQLKPKDVNFCYGSCDGLLWPVIEKLFKQTWLYNNGDLAISQRKDFLIKNKIGFCDIVESCNREKVDASDLGMSNVKLRDILGYVKKHKSITTIIFTGGNSKNGPEYFLRKVLKENDMKYNVISNNIPRVHEFIYDNRSIKTISLTSPSNAANRSIGANIEYKEKKRVEPKLFNI